MAGYSRTVRRSYEISPIRTMTRAKTVAKTGRLMQTSDRTMAASGLGRTRGPVDDHGRAVGDFLQARHHHLVAFRQSRDNLDAARAALADAHGDALGPVVYDAIHEAIFAGRNQGGFRHGQYAV